MSEIKVTFETITPLWIGDAWGDNSAIRPSSIMGSLRFWFEVICYFAGITMNDDYEGGKLKGNITSDQFEKGFLELQNKNPDKNYDELVDIALAGLGVPLPARIFGCTGWKGKIGIKEIDYDKNNFKNDLRGQIINGKNWFWGTPYYSGQFITIFDAEENILDTILYPLLTFMDKYGFWGGKWNIGYGRVKVSKVNGQEINLDDYEEFKFSEFHKYKKEKNNKIVLDGFYSDKKFDDIINDKTNFKELEKKDTSILVLEEQISNKNLKETIKELIKLKAEHRRDISNYSERHSVFGTISGGAQGTKILPWIEDGSELKGGFISIAGIINLE